MVLCHSPYAKRGLGRRCLPKNPFFSARRGRSPRLAEKRKVLGGPGTHTQRVPGVPPNLPHMRCLRKVSLSLMCVVFCPWGQKTTHKGFKRSTSESPISVGEDQRHVND